MSATAPGRDARFRVLVNATTLVQGGAIQVAVAFISQASADPRAEHWHFAVSRVVADELAGFGLDLASPRFTVYEHSPARDQSARQQLLQLAGALAPDLVFTVFGPAYVKFAQRHLCGIADGWITHPSWLAIRQLGSPLAMLRLLGITALKGYWFRQADYWSVEAEVARAGLADRWGCPRERITVIPNSVGPQFAAVERRARFPVERARVLCLAAYYKNKHLELVPAVAAALQRAHPALDFEICLTLPEDLPQLQPILRAAAELGVADRVINLGRVNVTELPDLYADSHVSFLPTLLETFTAVYPESMATGVPLVTTDLAFAHDICGDAAVYFEPKNAVSAAKSLGALLTDRGAWERQAEKGLARFAGMPDAAGKFELQMQLVASVADAQH